MWFVFSDNKLYILHIFLAYTHQYTDFNGLIETNRANGQEFSILAFPCNQFFLQEPAENHEIINGNYFNLLKFKNNIIFFYKIKIIIKI